MGPVPIGMSLAEAARSAAREDNYRILYRRVAGKEAGTIVFARSGEIVSVRYTSASGPAPVELYTREGAGSDLFCLNTQGTWRCEEGGDPAISGGAPVFVSPRSLERFAANAELIPGDQIRVSSREIAGIGATCFDMPPIPRTETAGRDPFAPDADTFTDLLDLGGSVCFGANKLLSMAILGETPLTFDAFEIGAVQASDLEAPANAEKIVPESPRPGFVGRR